MKIKVEKTGFLKVLSRVQNVVEKRNTVPILGHVLLEVSAESVKVTATDLEMTMVQRLDPARVSIEETGEATVSSYLLHEIVRKLPGDAEITLVHQPEKSRVVLRSGTADFSLASLAAEEFPETQRSDYDVTFSLRASDLVGMLNHTRFAMSNEETRHYLNGIYMHCASSKPVNADGAGDHSTGEDLLRFVATDGHRLARVETALPEHAESMPGVILPAKLVRELAGLFVQQEGDVACAISEKQACFSFGDVTVLSKLIDGVFPDYQGVIPAAHDRDLCVDAQVFAGAVDRVATVSMDKTFSLKLGLSKGKIRLSADNPDLGSALEDVPAEYQGEPMEIGFNARYLADVASQIVPGTMRFQLVEAAAPVVIRDQERANVLYVLMPLRI